MKVVPQLLYLHRQVKKIMVDGLSCIVYKTIDTIDIETDHYVAAHVLSVVLKGALKLQTYYEREQFMASQRQLVFIPRGRYMISDLVPENGAFEAVFFFFEEELIHQFLLSIQKGLVDIQEGKPCYVLQYSEKIRYFTESLLKLYQDGNDLNKAFTKLKLQELLYLLYYSDQKDHFLQLLASLQNRKKRNIQELMLLNYDKPLSIEDYAFLTGRSVSTFRRDFQRQFNISPKDWLIGKRLEKAAALLRTTPMYAISQVSLEVGYESISHFIHAFRKKYGVSPKQFLIQSRSEKVI